VLFALLAIAGQPCAWGQSFTTFDPPGSQGTTPTGINPAGQIVGTYFDSTFATHGFVRGSDGTITSFDVPGFLVNSNPPLITAFTRSPARAHSTRKPSQSVPPALLPTKPRMALWSKLVSGPRINSLVLIHTALRRMRFGNEA